MTMQHQIVGRFVFADAPKTRGNQPRAAVPAQTTGFDATLAAGFFAVAALTVSIWLLGI